MVHINHKSIVVPHLDILDLSELLESILDIAQASLSIQNADPNLLESFRVSIATIGPVSTLSVAAVVISIVLVFIIVLVSSFVVGAIVGSRSRVVLILSVSGVAVLVESARIRKVLVLVLMKAPMLVLGAVPIFVGMAIVILCSFVATIISIVIVLVMVCVALWMSLVALSSVMLAVVFATAISPIRAWAKFSGATAILMILLVNIGRFKLILIFGNFLAVAVLVLADLVARHVGVVVLVVRVFFRRLLLLSIVFDFIAIVVGDAIEGLHLNLLL